ncbi:hypothetical protein ASG01_14390 [Chryseobacterium sp. Leaf180]|nr:hypothetical protein ASG01_14390 [Chryseobacterium sp. Leaf180]
MILTTKSRKTMKKYIIAAGILISSVSFAQITIGKSAATLSPANSSVSLELGDATGGTRGMVLPYTTSAASVISPVAGTIIFDSSDKKIKYRNNTTTWFDLSLGAKTPASTVGVADANTEITSAKAVIGTNASADTTPGILVLSDTNKAMVLPRVASHTAIVNPSAGMMVYVTSTNQLAVYNGSEWSFWTKP